jgi:hypothetical protein
MPNFVPNNFKECDLDLKITLIYMHIFIHNIVREESYYENIQKYNRHLQPIFVMYHGVAYACSKMVYMMHGYSHCNADAFHFTNIYFTEFGTALTTILPTLFQ